MASTQDTEHELLPEQTEGYKVGEKKTMDEINKMGMFWVFVFAHLGELD